VVSTAKGGGLMKLQLSQKIELKQVKPEENPDGGNTEGQHRDREDYRGGIPDLRGESPHGIEEEEIRKD
jgi:hypothetical protein